MTPEQKAWIDNATYRDMLAKIRFAPLGDPFMRKGEELSDYFFARWYIVYANTPREEKVSASKQIGWG